MNRKWLAVLTVVGFASAAPVAMGAPAPSKSPGGQFQFVVVNQNDVKHFNTNLYSYAGVATSGTNYFCVGTNSIASLAGLNSPLAGGYLTNYSSWTAQNVTNGYSLNAITYGAGVFLAAGSANATFTYGTKWSNPLPALSGSSVSAEGVAYSSATSASNTFALVTASFQAAWAPANPTNWNAASDVDAAVVESFRGITSLGGNRFALCGVDGDIRISLDGGHTWNLNQEFDFSQPNLLGIASDGSNSLVAVGVGIVKISVNGGTNWITNSIPGLATNSLYGVTYTGPADNEFILVGGGGDIFVATNNTATNSWVWGTNYVSGTTSNLRAAAAATSGPLQGTLMAVGDNGTIVIGGTPPQPAISLGNQTNCASYPSTPSNPPLVVEVQPDSDHPAGSVTVDWFDSHMVPLTNAALYAIYTNNAAGIFTNITQDAKPFNDNTASNYVYYVRARDLRTGFVSTTNSITLTINPRPMASLLSFISTDCNEGPVYTLTNTLTGIGPWTVTWNDGTQQTTNLVGAGPVILTRTVYPTNSFGANAASNNVYYVTNIVDATSCYGNEAGDIMGAVTNIINPRPTASLLSFISTDCNEGPVYTLTNTLTGIGPWTVTWNDGTQQTTNLVGAGPVILTRTVYPTNSFGANAASNNVYYVTNIVDATSCYGNQTGDITGTVTNVINPRPTASLLSFATTDCNEGPVYTLTNTLTGIGTMTVTWNDGAQQTTNLVGGGPVVLTRTVYPTNSFAANVASNNIFFVTGIVDGTGCYGDHAGDITGVVTNTINPRPTSSLLSFISTDCNEGPVYTLTNTLTGLGPWTIYWNDGFIQTNTLATNGAVYFTRTVYPTNSFGANAASNNVFYVTNLVDGTGCYGDQAGDITGSVTNIVNPRPTAALLSFATAGCNEGPVYTLTNTLTGIGTMTVTWNDGTQQTTNLVGGGPVILTRTVYPTNSFAADMASNNVYYVTNIVDGTGCYGNLPGDITGVVTNTINPRPTAALLSFISTDCNEGPVYILTNTLTGLGPWTIYWNDGFIQTNTLATNGAVYFTRTVYPTNSFGANTASNNVFYVTNLVDGTGCYGDQAGDITGSVTNIVNPRPTAALLSFATAGCNEGPVYTLTNTLTGIGTMTVTWNDGTQQTTNLVGGGPVILTRTVYPTNSFAADAASNNVYYVTGITDGTGCVGDQVGDITGVVTNAINPRPTTSLLSFTSTNCNDGVTFTLTNTLTGLGPWTLYWNDGYIQTNVLVTNGPVYFTRTVYPTNIYGNLVASNNVFYVIAISNADTCAGNLAGDITGAVTNWVYPTPLALALTAVLPQGVTGEGIDSAGDIFETNVLSQTQDLYVVDQPSYVLNWYDETLTNLLAGDTFTYTPANIVCGVYTNYVTITDTNGGCSGGITAVIQVLVPPVPVSLGNETNNALVPNPTLAVNSYQDANNPAGRIVSDWYDASTAGNLLASATNSYTPGTGGTVTVWAGARDTVTGLVSPTRTGVTLMIVTNPPCAAVVIGSTVFTLNFNDLPYSTSGESMSTSYAGLTWNNFAEANGPNNNYNPSGYGAGTVAPGTNVVVNAGGLPANISSSAPFDLISGYFTAAWNNNLNLEIQGFNGGVKTYDTNFTLSATVPTNLQLGYSNITEVNFISSGGTHDPDYVGTGFHFAIGNLVLATNLVPQTNYDCVEPDAPIPLATGFETNCAGLFDPSLIVEVGPGDSVNWYADATGTNLLAREVGTNSFTPTVTAPGVYTYYAQTVDTNNYASTNLTPVTLVLQSCTNAPEVFSLGAPATNNVVSWFGNLLLESTTNLVPPINWVTNSTGLPGTTNYWTNTVVMPVQFFRLYAPTN